MRRIKHPPQNTPEVIIIVHVLGTAVDETARGEGGAMPSLHENTVSPSPRPYVATAVVVAIPANDSQYEHIVNLMSTDDSVSCNAHLKNKWWYMYDVY